MVDSPWLTVSSRTELYGSTSGSNVALHSIYGSQVSQLPLTLSKASLEEEEEEEDDDDDGWPSFHDVSRSQTNVRRSLLRPKTAPASKSLTRLNRPSSAVHSMTVNTTIRRLNRNRPTTALPNQSIQVAKRRNSTSSNSQQLTVHHYSGIGSGNQRRASRPSTAQPLRGGRSIGARPSTARPLSYTSPLMADSSSIVSSNTEDTTERMKEKTIPVSLTNVPKYFNFWNEKPIRQREWGVPTHERRPRKSRPKSDYGIRGLNRNRNDSGDGKGGSGDGRDGNDTGLGILFEVADGSFSSGDQDERGRKKRKGKRKGHKGDGSDSSDEENNSKTNNETEFNKEGLDGGLNDSTLLNELRGVGGDGSDDDPNSRNKGVLDGENGDEKDLEYRDLEGGNEEDNDAENDDYFSQKKKDKHGKSKSLNDLDSYAARYCSAMSTRFELPMDLKLLEVMTPMEYLSKHCIISQRRKFHYLKTFTKLKRKDTYSTTIATLTDKEVIVEGIIRVHFEVVTKEEVYNILQVADYTTDKTIDFQLFGALCALTERRYCSQRPGFSRKELIEVVDFEALDWRLRNCVLSHSLKALFQIL